MTGYFSQLIQQTGIVVGGRREAQSEGSLSAPAVSTDTQEIESVAVGDLLQVEDVEVMVPPIESVAPPAAASPAKVEDTASPSEVSNEPPTLERIVEREIIPLPSDSTETRFESSLPASTSSSDTEFVIQEGSPTAAHRDRIEIRESVDRAQDRQIRKPVSDPTIPEEAVVIEKSEIEQFEEKQVEAPSSQTYWQVVREWVTDTPKEDDRVQEVDVSRGPAFFEPTETAIVQEPQQHLATSEMVENLDPTRIEHQELVLSIGSIQVTVEHPPPTVQQPTPPAPQPIPKAKPSLDASRLRRHYIRFR